MIKAKEIEKIKKELIKRGIKADVVEVVKDNGMICTGFSVLTDSSIRPIVYYSPTETLEDFMSRLSEAVKHASYMENIYSRDYVMANLSISVRRKSTSIDDDVLKRGCLNLEAVLRLRIDSEEGMYVGSIGVSDQLLQILGVKASEAWDSALANLKSSIFIRNIADFLGFSEAMPGMFDVITTTNYCNGAAALLIPEIFNDYCWKKGVKACVILPSSTQEVLVIPDNGEFSYYDLALMVKEVNSTVMEGSVVVEEAIKLDPVVYRYSLEANEIIIISEA